MLASGLVAATVIDLRTRRIPNALTAALAAAGFVMALTGVSRVTPLAAAVGFGLGMLLMLPGRVLGATGGGDVKLMAAVGAVIGPGPVVSAFLVTAIAGGVLALAVAARRGRVGVTLAGTGRLVTTPSEAKRELEAPARANRFAYGPAIAIGGLAAALMR